MEYLSKFRNFFSNPRLSIFAIVLILIGIAITISNIRVRQEKTTHAVSTGFTRGVSHLWNDFSKWNSDIDKASYYGVDSIQTGPTGGLPKYIAGVKNGSTDYIGAAMNYAHSKNIKFYLLMSIATYSNNDWEAFKNSSTAQNQFLSDLAWILQRYPTLDGIEMEEPHSHGTPPDGGTAWRAFNNAFFKRANGVIAQYRPTDKPDTFMWSFNSASNFTSNVKLIGLDVDYINANRLFNTFHIQNATTSLTAFQSNITTWKARLPNLRIASHIYLNWSGLVNACKTQYPDWNSPTCWNQAFFDEMKWANSVGHPVRIFVFGRLGMRSSLWPNDTTPGTTAGDKVKYIWGDASTTVSAPVFSPSAGIYSSPQKVSISTLTSGAIIYYTTDNSTPTTSSTVYTSPITISTTTTLKTMAVKSGYANSLVASGIYTIVRPDNPPPLPSPIDVTPTYVTPTIRPVGNYFNFNILLHGIGLGGDTPNPNSSGNFKPKHPRRNIAIDVYNNLNKLVLSKIGEIEFASSSGNFTGRVDMGNSLADGSYMVKIKSKQYLRKSIQGIISFRAGKDNTFSQVTLVTGDINNDNIINIFDYNLLIGCYSDLSPARQCNNTADADLTDDGEVNQFDYNLFLREITNRAGA